MSGTVPLVFLYFLQRHDATGIQTQQNFRFDAIDTRLNAMDTRFDAMDTRLDRFDTRLGRLEWNVKNLSAQTTNCTADCVDAKRALLNYGLLPRRLNTVEKKFGGQNGLVDPAKNRNVNEKITDSARNLFEKATGKNVPEEFSN